MSKVIGFCGKKGAGKDTAADALLEEGWARVRFSQSLKEITADAFDIKPLFLEDAAFKDVEFDEPIRVTKHDVLTLCEKLPLDINNSKELEIMLDMVGREFKTPRELLQYVGTDIVRNKVDVNGWVKIAQTKIKEWFDRGENVVVTDVRFPNEADVITQLGGQLVKIDRKQEIVDTHESEKQDFNVDLILDNNEDIYDLHKKVRGLL